MILILKIYQMFVSPTINYLTGSMNGACRFSPTCSIYVEQAIGKYGIMRGILIGLKRIARCHPWSKGGHDPVYV